MLNYFDFILTLKISFAVFANNLGVIFQGVTGHEMCHYFYEPAVRMEWECKSPTDMVVKTSFVLDVALYVNVFCELISVEIE